MLFFSAFQRADPTGAHPRIHLWGQEVGASDWPACAHMPHSSSVGGGSFPPQSHWDAPMEIRALGAGRDAGKHQIFAMNELDHWIICQNEWWVGREVIVLPVV